MKKLEIQWDGQEVTFSLPLGDSQGRMSMQQFEVFMRDIREILEVDDLGETFLYEWKLKA